MTDTQTLAAKSKRKMAREPNANVPSVTGATDTQPAATKRESKTDLVLGLLQRPEGATIDQLVAATGWLPHTARAALTGLKKKGHTITSEKLDGQARVYRVTAP